MGDTESWSVFEDSEFDPGDCRSPLKWYILEAADGLEPVTYSGLAAESGMAPKMSSAYLGRLARESLLACRETPGTAPAEYRLTDRGRERLEYYREEFGPGKGTPSPF